MSPCALGSAKLNLRFDSHCLGRAATRTMTWRDYIFTDPDVCHGQACVKGTRAPVSVVRDNLAAGLPEDEIIRSYPALTSDAIRAATAYAAELARERIIELPRRNAA